jgi:hypothetical protein
VINVFKFFQLPQTGKEDQLVNKERNDRIRGKGIVNILKNRKKEEVRKSESILTESLLKVVIYR